MSTWSSMGGLPANAKEAVTENQRRREKSGEDHKRGPEGGQICQGHQCRYSVQCNAEDESPSDQR